MCVCMCFCNIRCHIGSIGLEVGAASVPGASIVCGPPAMSIESSIDGSDELTRGMRLVLKQVPMFLEAAKELRTQGLDLQQAAHNAAITSHAMLEMAENIERMTKTWEAYFASPAPSSSSRPCRPPSGQPPLRPMHPPPPPFWRRPSPPPGSTLRQRQEHSDLLWMDVMNTFNLLRQIQGDAQAP